SVAASGDIVSITVGPDKKQFRVHKDTLCHHSEYLRTVFNGRWAESDNKAVVLEDVDTGVFGIFIDWLYTQRLPKPSACIVPWWEAKHADVNKDGLHVVLPLAKAYALGDRIMAPVFRRAVNSQFITNCEDRLLHTCSVYEVAIWAFNNIPADRPILQFLADFHCKRWYPGGDRVEEARLYDELPPSFLLRGFRKAKERPFAAFGNRCYIEHESVAEKNKCWARKNVMHMVYNSQLDLAEFKN
ncbi:hypothetical protein CC80DRAFT_415410, partial [Byssothecium circinans]